MIKLTGKRIIFPFYHLVSDEDVPHIRHLHKIRTSKEFSADLDFLLKHYKPLSVGDYLDSLNHGSSLPGNSFILSFDDGLREFHDVAAPILIRKGIPAVCFLNSSFIGNADLFYRYKASLLVEEIINGNGNYNIKKILSISYDTKNIIDEIARSLNVDFVQYLREKRPYLDSEMIRSLMLQGFTFGSHSIDHPEYRFITEEEQIRQTKESLSDIRKKFNINERLFCFPFTDHGVKLSFFEKIFDSSDVIADLTFGGAGMKDDPVRRNIQRIPLEGTSLNAPKILGTEYLYYMIKFIFGKNMIIR